jgi:hypothetical protein
MKRIHLPYLLSQLQASIERADPELARALVAEPPRRLGEPFVFEYIDRLIAALRERIDSRDLRRYPELPLYRQMIRNLRRLRAGVAKGV